MELQPLLHVAIACSVIRQEVDITLTPLMIEKCVENLPRLFQHPAWLELVEGMPSQIISSLFMNCTYKEIEQLEQIEQI